ncbi:MAG: hypothetical protein FJW27_09500 [Acidimicrobiia bacterium]|nr:hypothetical protein [Acidimicrobiia bacterium]
MNALFQFFFKYPSFVFEKGEFTFTASRTMALAIGVAALLAIATLVTYRRVHGGMPRRDRLVLTMLRVGLVGLLAFCLFRPSLVLKGTVPQQNFLGVLLDDSRSMTIADRDGQARTQFIENQFGQPDSQLLNALSEKFVLRFFRFSNVVDRLKSPGDLRYGGSATRLGPALERARDELAGLPLAGLVLVTDGADTSDATLEESLASLKARSVPVFPVGVGRDRFDRDIQVTRVETPRSTLKGTTLAVDVVISHTGYAGTTVPLTVEDEGRIAATQDVTLPSTGDSTTVRMTFTAGDTGARLFRFQVKTQADEQVTQNNARDALVEVSDRRDKILYMEGEPRFEMKFIRRAVEEDQNLQVVILQRTAEDKYLRLDVGSKDELVGGFPKTREELFAYRAVILGSVEAASFSPDQLRMLADYVSKRGGGLLMLGGRRAFAEGGWAGTPVAEVLPVDMDAPARGSGAYFSHVSVKPTRDGLSYPVTQLPAAVKGAKSSGSRWDDLPALSAVNAIRSVKPGATKLLSGTDDNRQEQVVLAYQRYGRGKALALPVQDSWLWRMDATIAVEDTTHATFWRRLIRWLVDGVPDQVSVTTSERVEPGELMKLTAEVVDPAFVEVNDAQVVAHVTTPSGKVVDIPMEWSVSKDGEYRASFVPDEAGLYEVKTTATRTQGDLGTSVVHTRASAGDAEYFDAAMRSTLLQRIAEDTGGRFFTADTASELPEAITVSGRGVTVIEERDLWDMPIILMLLLGIIGAEWGYRRLRGLA